MTRAFSKVITLQLTGPISGNPAKWSCSVSGVSEVLLERLKLMKPQLKVLSSYEFDLGDHMGLGFLKLYTVSWEFDERKGQEKTIHETVIPVEGVNDALNFLGYNGYRLMSSTSTVNTSGEGFVVRKSIVWTFETN